MAKFAVNLNSQRVSPQTVDIIGFRRTVVIFAGVNYGVNVRWEGHPMPYYAIIIGNEVFMESICEKHLWGVFAKSIYGDHLQIAFVNIICGEH